jgi:hypothetical protein
MGFQEPWKPKKLCMEARKEEEEPKNFYKSVIE